MEAPTPREHGAWGILIQSFAAGALLARNWTWLLLPAAGLAFLGFLIKDPLIVFVRERWIWKRPGSSPKWLLIEGAGLALCFGTLLPFLPVLELALLGAAAAGLTAMAVWFTVHNRQKSIWLQLLSSAGLCSAALLAILASRSELPGWAWTLWALLALHASAIIPVVHARLRRKAVRVRPSPVLWLT